MFKRNNTVKDLGGCIVSNNILNGKGTIKWVFREEPVNDRDNGWRFLSNIDDEDYINNPLNLSVCDFNSIKVFEPSIFLIYNLPIGTELEIINENNKKYFIDHLTGKTYK